MLKRIIGLTGGIATGKSTVSHYLAQKYQIPILDADIYAREAVQTGSPILTAIYRHYGNSVRNSDGSLNRKALGKIIFDDPQAKTWLENQIHPYVRDKLESELQKLSEPIIVLVVPLLFEAQMTELVTEIWVVWSSVDQQKARIITRDGLNEEEAIARINSQLSLNEKAALADFVLDNSTTPENLYQQVDLAMKKANNLKIVSLLPSATEIVAELGLSDALVGVSHECDYPPEVQELPTCTKARLKSDQASAAIDRDVQSLLNSAMSIYDLDIETLKQLKPTHIITQDQCDVCAVTFADVEAAAKELLPSQPQIISLQPNRLTEVWADIQRVADILAVNTESLLDSLQSRIQAIASYTKTLPSESRPKVGAIEWIDPLMVGGNWIHELIELAGGKPLFSEIGQPSTYISWESLCSAQPDILVIMPCGFDLERTKQESQILPSKPNWSNLPAVQQNRVFITDGNAYFNRPGPRLVDSLEILAEILHPEQFNFAYQHEGWELYNREF